MSNEKVFGTYGVVERIIVPYKAIVQFEYNGKYTKALLFSNKVVQANGELPFVDDRPVIVNLVHEGETLHFDAHSLSTVGRDECNWLITRAWRPGSSVPFTGTGAIFALAPRQGCIAFGDGGGAENRIFFLASKVYLHGARLNQKQNLGHVLSEGDPVQFEVIEIKDQNDDKSNSLKCSCKYFANVVWKGKRPDLRKGITEGKSTIESTTRHQVRKTRAIYPVIIRTKTTVLSLCWVLLWNNRF
jgi:hypothetical protein